MDKSSDNNICSRIARIRMEFAGPRGKSSFASGLGLSASTYAYYESSRVPPAEILVKIADQAGVDLRWLLTGDEPGPGDVDQVPPSHPAVRRAAELLRCHANAAKPLAAFLDILSATMKFPAKPGEVGGLAQSGEPSQPIELASAELTQPVELTSAELTQPGEVGESVSLQAPAGDAPGQDAPAGDDPAGASWIPVLGRSAAGVPCFWSNQAEAAGVTTLGELVGKHLGDLACLAERTDAMQSSPESSRPGSAQPVQLIRLPEPLGELDTTEYVSASAIKEQYRDAFAVWIDGESMSPEIRHGDLVLLSPSAPARAGRSAVVQLREAIGVTCKLYHPAGEVVHLVPINEQFPPTAARAQDVQWSLQVLARIRLGGR